MLFSSFLERSLNTIIKSCMPLVYVYHLVCSNHFLNTTAVDAKGLEALANTVLTPLQYLFEGKNAIPNAENYYFERRFDYEHYFFIKTACAITLLPVSVPVGCTLKACAYLSTETRQRAKQIKKAWKAPPTHSNVAYYQQLGLKIENWTEAEWILPPQYKRRLDASHNLKEDIEALGAIVTLLRQAEIPFWIDCGSCLGAYRYGGAIPWDWDIDIAVLAPDFDNVRRTLLKLDPQKYKVQDWSGRDKPQTYLKVYVKASRNLIDIYHFGINPEKQELYTILSNEKNIFLSQSWKTRELRYTVPMPFSRIFPLKRALFEGIEVPVPGQIEEYLQAFYGNNLAPSRIYNEITQQYEKDLSHPYWQLPCVQ